MPSRNTIGIIVGVAALIYFGGFLVLEAPAWRVLMQLSGLAVLSVPVLLYAFDRFLWKLPGVNYFAKRPVLHGTWKGTFESDYEYPETTGKREGSDRGVPRREADLLLLAPPVYHPKVRLGVDGLRAEDQEQRAARDIRRLRKQTSSAGTKGEPGPSRRPDPGGRGISRTRLRGFLLD